MAHGKGTPWYYALTAVSSPALAMGLCVAMIAFVRLPSLKVSCLLLSGLLIYDVFWVRPVALKPPLSFVLTWSVASGAPPI